MQTRADISQFEALMNRAVSMNISTLPKSTGQSYDIQRRLDEIDKEMDDLVEAQSQASYYAAGNYQKLFDSLLSERAKLESLL